MIKVDANVVVTKLIEDSIRGAWDKVKVFFTDTSKKEKIDCRDAFEYYLNKTKEKNIKIKTLIYRREPVELYSFYECVGVKIKDKIVDTSSIKNLFKIGNKLIISGTGGIGKSILLKHLFLNSIVETNLVPVLIELRCMSSEIEKGDFSLEKAVYENLKINGFEFAYEYYEYSLKKGAYIFLLDGYDELNKNNTQIISQAIKNMSNKYEKNKFIVSSRPSEEFISWNDFVEVASCNLNKKQALELISKIKFDENIKEKFYKALDESLYEKYNSFASNPLLLNIMLLTFETHAIVPDNLIDFYDNAFSALFTMHDATKDSFVRDIKSKLGCEDFKNVLAHICLKSYFNNEFEFTDAKLNKYIKLSLEKNGYDKSMANDFKEDLVSSVCMFIKDGVNYKFSHRSFQEYFSAWYMCKLVDDVQVELFKDHLNKSFMSPNDLFFPMLFNMQKDKFNEIFLCPYIKEIKEIYDDIGFSIEMIEKLFTSLSIRKIKEKPILGIIYSGNNNYARILFLACGLNGFVNKKAIQEKEKFAEKLNKYFCNKEYNIIPIRELKKYFSEEEILLELQWLNERLIYAFSILKKYIGKKKSNIKDLLNNI